MTEAIEKTIQGEMQERLEEWQGRLRLRDWDIKVEVVTSLEMDSNNAYGQVRWDMTERCADIKLLHPDDIKRINGMRPAAIEETLIHELIHLLMAPFQESLENGDANQEFCINAIARSLYQMALHERDLLKQLTNPVPTKVPGIERPSLPPTVTIATASALEYLDEPAKSAITEEVAKQITEVIEKEMKRGGKLRK